MVKVSVVSYLNSKPFIYGLQNSGLLKNLELNLDLPYECANKILHDKADIALVPVAMIPALKSYSIVSDYCIGADGPVKSVYLFSQVPLNEIKKIHLDFHSLTSKQLAKLLAKNYWKISPQWENIIPFTGEDIVYDSVVLIGDKTFKALQNYNFAYDLADEWKKYTGLPFVFACWISTRKIPADIQNAFNNALEYGVTRIREVVRENSNQSYLSEEEMYNYLSKNIKYNLNYDLKKGMDTFISML